MKKNNVLIVILVFIICLLVGFIVYDKFLSTSKVKDNDKDNDSVVNNKKNYSNYTEDCSTNDGKCMANYVFDVNNKYESVVSAEDTFDIAVNPMFGKQIYILHDGILYYEIEKCNENGYCNFQKYDLSHNNDAAFNLKKFEKVSNIKRVKSYNGTTGVDYSLFLITNDGIVYRLSYDIGKEDFSFEVVKEFAKYQVDDILDYEFDVPYGSSYKVILKDGTTLTKMVTVKD